MVNAYESPTLETDRLTLVSIDETYKEFILNMNENDQMQATLPDIPLSKEVLLHRDDWLEISEGKIIAGAWVMLSKENNSPIGTIKFSQMPISDSAIKPVDYSDHVEIGYRCIPSSWGKGYMSEAAKIALEHVFTSGKLDKIVACTDFDNYASQTIIQKIGLKPDGEFFCHGAIHPFYSVKREDWLASRGDIS